MLGAVALELQAEVEKETALRAFITCVLRERAAEVKEILTDDDRASLVEQLKEFWGDLLEDTVLAAIDREFAEKPERK